MDLIESVGKYIGTIGSSCQPICLGPFLSIAKQNVDMRKRIEQHGCGPISSFDLMKRKHIPRIFEQAGSKKVESEVQTLLSVVRHRTRRDVPTPVVQGIKLKCCLETSVG